MVTHTRLHTLQATHDHGAVGVDAEHRRAIFVMTAAVLALACVGLLALRLWPAPSRSFEHVGAVTDIAFSPDGQLVATGSSDRTIRLWQVENGQLLAILRGHTDWVYGLAFSPGNTTK
jgi:WD40 repeat protein